MRFAVVIPARDAARTLPGTLAALRAQTATDWEGVVVDDGSSDGTAAAVRALRDPRLRVIGGAGRGPSAARNLGVRATRAPILCFLDADDLWAPDKLARTARAMAAAEGAVGRCAFFDADPARPETVSAAPPARLTLDGLLGENPACTSSNIAVRRDAFAAAGGFDEALRAAEDLDLLIRLVGGGARIAGIGAVTTFYRRSEGGLSADLDAMRAGHRRALASAARFGARPGPAAEAVHLRYLARRALRLGADPRRARAYALEGLRLAPRAFLHPLRRGVPTLGAALAAPLFR